MDCCTNTYLRCIYIHVHMYRNLSLVCVHNVLGQCSARVMSYTLYMCSLSAIANSLSAQLGTQVPLCLICCGVQCVQWPYRLQCVMVLMAYDLNIHRTHGLTCIIMDWWAWQFTSFFKHCLLGCSLPVLVCHVTSSVWPLCAELPHCVAVVMAAGECGVDLAKLHVGLDHWQGQDSHTLILPCMVTPNALVWAVQ